MLIQLQNGVPVGNPVLDENFFMLYPDVSFPLPLSPADVAPYSFGLYEYSAQPTPSTYQNVVEVTPVQNAQQIWVQTWQLVEMTPEEVAAKNEVLKQANKAQAASLLTATDWTTIPDVSDPALSDPYLTNAAEFAAYRSQIRKIAVNPPVTVDPWPVEPEEVWAYTTT